jgi:hypothetical protein
MLIDFNTNDESKTKEILEHASKNELSQKETTQETEIPEKKDFFSNCKLVEWSLV